MRARLVSADGGKSYDLTKDMTLLGRDGDCDIKLEHKSVSKLQCVLVMTDGVVLVRDLGSTNGTRVNGQRVRRAALLPNDTLAVANVRYLVKFGPDLDDEPAARRARRLARRNELPDVYPEDEPEKA
jgi:pSer/pThr/pTyr-binding forkhead associated (FHA) protein